MVQLSTKNTALVLYGVLLVLPTIVLGGLHWRQLAQDHRSRLAAVPGDAGDAGRRLSDAIQRRVLELIEREERRPFYVYKRTYFPPGMIGAELALVPSPLATGPTPEGCRAWFQFATSDSEITPPAQPPAVLEILGGEHEGLDAWAEERADLVRTVAELAERDRTEVWLMRAVRVRSLRLEPLTLSVAAINTSPEKDFACLRDELPALRGLQGRYVDAQVTGMHVRFFFDAEGTPRVVASRMVIIPPNESLRDLPACFDNLGSGVTLIQGFFIDPQWLFHDLPAGLARQVLDVAQEFVPFGASETSDLDQVIVSHPIHQFVFETRGGDEAEYGTFRVAVNTRDLELRFRSQMLHFLGVAAMLVISLTTGMVLLLRSVHRDLESAKRTENFVAAVTHELRTPLASIRLYGEMLQDGWVDSVEKREEYYRRIVRETGRLETLVERVLEKSQLTSNEVRPELGDLSQHVDSVRPSLCHTAVGKIVEDVRFELDTDLPDVFLIPDAVRSIVTNLVENARKYAPVPIGVPEAEPIGVVTRIYQNHVVLEVKDRGPGIPREEKHRIFDAFYRVGTESTRTAKGTGLGLHLVALQALAMQARVQVLDRKGGGTIFRVTFRRGDRAAEDTPPEHA